jgi:WD40 repeat protein
LEWLATGELHYKLGNTDGPSFNLIYDPAAKLISAITPTPFPTPVSPLPVQVKEQVYGADIAWSPDGKTLAVASCYAGCRLELLNPADLSLLWSVELNDSSTNLRFSPNGEYIAVGEDEILLLHAQDGAVAWATKLTDGSATRVEFSPNGENITVLIESFTSAPNEIRFLDMRDGKILSQWKVGSAESFSYSPSGEQIVTTGETLTLWNVSNGIRSWEMTPDKFTERSGGCQVNKFDQAIFSQNHQAYLFARGTARERVDDYRCNALLALNLKTQKMVVLQAELDSDPIFPHLSVLYFDESTSELLVHQQYLGLQRWNVETQEITAVEQPGDFIFSNDFAQFAPMAKNGDFYFDSVLEFSSLPNQTWLALSVEAIGDGWGYEDFYLYDLSTGAWLDLFPLQYVTDWSEYFMQSPSLSPDGHWLAAINSNGKLRVWNMGFGLHSINTTVQPNAMPEPTSIPAFSCPLAPKPRVKVGDNARITFTNGQKTRLRSAPEAGDNMVAMLAEGTEFEIIDGPVCYPRPGRNDAYVYWKISVTANSQEGWLAEGDFDSYYIEPLP